MSKRYYQEYGPIARRGKKHVPEIPAVQPLEHGNQGQQVEHRAPRRPPRRRFRSVLIWLLALLVIVVVGAGGGLIYLNELYSGRIYPNIAIHGINVGNTTPEKAQAALRARLESFLEQPVRLSYGGRSWQPTLQDLGVTVDINGTVDKAFDIGRGLNIIESAQEVAITWQDGLVLPMHLTVDGPRMKRYLESIAAGVDEPPMDATLVIGETSAQVTSSQEGRMVLIDETMADLLGALETLTPQTVAVRTKALPPQLLDRGIVDAQQTIDAILQSPITLTISDNRKWTLSQDDLRAMIRTVRVKGQGTSDDRLEIKLDEIALRQRITRIADEIGRGSVNPRLNFNDQTDQLTIIKPGQTGLRLDEEASYERVIEQLTGSERTIELAVEVLEPQVTEANLHSLGIKEVVGVGKSSFKGSAAYRIHNIEAGNRLLEGLLIAPGEEFSFNEAVGSIDETNGFVQGYAIVGNRTQLEFGGGICQDSTTLFRAAFYAGLPFTEWHYHSFRISWYEEIGQIGMDATIFTGALDLRFVNDTGNWLLLQTYMDKKNQVLTYVLYGTKPSNRQVVASKPVITNEIPPPAQARYIPSSSIAVGHFKRTDIAQPGMTVTVYRVITENGVVMKREPFVTRFKPWQEVWLYNPQTPLPPPGCKPYVCWNPAKPKPTQPPAPQPTQPPAPQPTQAPAPQPTQPPAPQPTQPPAPQPTQAPAPQPTQAPAPPTPQPIQKPSP